MKHQFVKLLKLFTYFLFFFSFTFLCPLLTGCTVRNKEDPLETYNRAMYKINKAVDKIAIKPAAQIYVAILPKSLRQSVNNFFQNLRTIPTIFNDILQGNRQAFYSDCARFILNTTWGVGGLFDVAARGGLERRYVDFGLTLAHWGYRNSTYIVLPFYGPSTFRDTLGMGVTYYMSVWPYLSQIRMHHHKLIALRNGLFIVDVIDTRADLLDLEKVLEAGAIDEYALVKAAYLQNRNSIIECNASAPTTGPTSLSTDILPEPPE